jgi:hypothetical protein
VHLVYMMLFFVWVHNAIYHSPLKRSHAAEFLRFFN